MATATKIPEQVLFLYSRILRCLSLPHTKRAIDAEIEDQETFEYRPQGASNVYLEASDLM